MPQGVLPFQYQEETSSAGMTGLTGLPLYLDLAYVAGLCQSIGRHLKRRRGKQGWSDAQLITSLVLLNLAGGDSVEDLEILEKDEGFSQVLRRVEHHGAPKRGSMNLRVGSDSCPRSTIKIANRTSLAPSL